MSRRSRATVALAAACCLAGCGILDGIFGAALRNDGELCTRATELSDVSTTVCGERNATLDCDEIECARSNSQGACAAEADRFFACLGDTDDDCLELAGGGGFCQALLDQFVDCTGQVCAGFRCDGTAACGADEVCSGLNGLFCDNPANQADPSCDDQLPGIPRCTQECFASNDACGVGSTCVESDPLALGRQRGCEDVRCDVTSDCDDGYLCAQPLSMAIDVPGFCLPRCQPLECLGDDTGDACACNDLLTHCAPVREGAVVVDFACTMRGEGAVNSACAEEGDCDNDTACVEGTCVPLCQVSANDCGAAACVALKDDVGTCR